MVFRATSNAVVHHSHRFCGSIDRLVSTPKRFRSTAACSGNEDVLNTVVRDLQALYESTGDVSSRLCLRCINTNSPDTILQRIVDEEKVHPIANVEALQQRLGTGRRCYALFHPMLPEEPLCFVHIALLSSIADSMDIITGRNAIFFDRNEERAAAKAAMFYSISASQPRLSGIDLGNVLIKGAARELKHDAKRPDGPLPELHLYSTLSPMPNFRSWVQSVGLSLLSDGVITCKETGLVDGLKTASELEQLITDDAFDVGEFNVNPLESDLLRNYEEPIVRMASYYLSHEKRQPGVQGDPPQILCPVGNFHVRNGAEVYRVNFLADKTTRGMSNSLGTMVNYRYNFEAVETNRARYVARGEIAYGSEFHKMVLR